MGVKTPIPPIAMNARRPEGRPAAGSIRLKIFAEYHDLGANIQCSSPFLQSKKNKIIALVKRLRGLYF